MMTPPYRADHVGSLLRPAKLAATRKAHLQEATATADELKAVEDAAIADAIAMQEDVGLKAVTDGEFRRSWWHYDFMGMLDGLELVERDEGVQFAGIKLRPIYPTITAPLASHAIARCILASRLGPEAPPEDPAPGPEQAG